MRGKSVYRACVFSASLVLVAIFAVSLVSSLEITEVELNPEGDDSGNEWVEIFSESEFDLGGHYLENADGDIWNLTGNFSGPFPVIFVSQWLDNEEEKVFLKKGNETIDETSFLEDKENDGRAWSRCNNLWEFLNSTKGQENNCDFQVNGNLINTTDADGNETGAEEDGNLTVNLLNGNDLGLLLGAWGECSSESDACENYDFDKDGKIDETDRDILLALWGTDGVFNMEKTDINKDGTVSGSDLGLALGAWGSCDFNMTSCDSDINEDGAVGDADIGLIMALWGHDFSIESETSGNQDSSVRPSGGGGGGGGSSNVVFLQEGGSDACFAEWVCSEWTECANGEQTRICSKDREECFISGFSPETARTCEGEAEEESSFGQGTAQLLSIITGAVVGADGKVKSNGVLMFIALLVAIYAFSAAWRARDTSGENEKGKSASKKSKKTEGNDV